MVKAAIKKGSNESESQARGGPAAPPTAAPGRHAAALGTAAACLARLPPCRSDTLPVGHAAYLRATHTPRAARRDDDCAARSELHCGTGVDFAPARQRHAPRRGR